MPGFLHILHSKPLKNFYPELVGTLVEFVGLKWGQLGKGNFVFDLKHFWDALQTFYTLWGTFCGGLGRVSVTVNQSEKLDEDP